MGLFRRFGALAFAGAILVTLAPAAARASAQADVVATVHQFIDGFNKGDVKSAFAACAPSVSIIDEFPPHRWVGTGACETWAAAYDADAKKNGITDGNVTLLAPWHVEVDGETAYAVIPANYTYEQKGKPVAEMGSVLTVVLEKLPAGWRITSWAWARH